ncbi:MAG: hypothetical protein D6744_09510, partial [Planctomycetota bacterium]
LRFRVKKSIVGVAVGAAFVLSGCDANVRDTVLSGVETATTTLGVTFLQAFFESLMSQDEETATTVKAITEFAPGVFA